MAYLPNIPNAPDKISQSQIDLKNNFQQLNAGFQVDHNAYDAALAGEHKQVTIPVALGADPAVANPAGIFYTKQVAAVTQAFFSNGTTVSQLTGLPNDVVGDGSITLAAGLILKWGFVGAAGYNPTVAFTVPFPANCFNVQLTGQLNDQTAKSFAVKDSSVTNLGFTIQSSANTAYTGVYWFAIGN